MRRIVLSDDLSMPDWQRQRGLQLGGPADAVADNGGPILSDDMSIGDWQRTRDLHAQGGDVMVGGAGDDALTGGDEAGRLAPNAHLPSQRSDDSAKRARALESGAGALLKVISQAEGTDRDDGYDVTFGYGKYAPSDTKKLSAMTLDDVARLQAEMVRRGSPGSAVGKYQIKDDTLAGLRRTLKLSGQDVFTPALQDRLGRELLRIRHYDEYLAGKIDSTGLQASLAKEWSSLPKDRSDHSHYGDEVRSRIPTTQLQSAIKAGGDEFSRARDEGYLPPALGWR